MHRAALLQNKLKTQLFISKITALSPYNDHKSLEAKLAALTNEAGCSSRGAGWARTDADPSDGTEPGRRAPLATRCDRTPTRSRATVTRRRRRATQLPKRPLNRNVKITLCYQPSLNVCTSLATASPLAAYVLLRTGSNARVGYAVGAMGVANLCAAFPAAWLADRWSRTAVIRTAVIIGAFGFCSLVASVVLGDHIHANKQFLCICASTAIIGCFVGSQSSAVEAIFGDSIPSGSRSRLYVRKQSLRVLGTAAGPLLAVSSSRRWATTGARASSRSSSRAALVCFFARRCWFWPVWKSTNVASMA